MSARAYIFVNCEDDNVCRVVKILWSKADVERVEVIEGRPDIIVAMQARTRQKLAKSVLQTLKTIESLTSDTQVLPVKRAYTSHQIDKPTQATKRVVN
jgi:hypothetical protein